MPNARKLPPARGRRTTVGAQAHPGKEGYQRDMLARLRAEGIEPRAEQRFRNLWRSPYIASALCPNGSCCDRQRDARAPVDEGAHKSPDHLLRQREQSHAAFSFHISSGAGSIVTYFDAARFRRYVGPRVLREPRGPARPPAPGKALRRREPAVGVANAGASAQ